jgi:hypothetical protein
LFAGQRFCRACGNSTDTLDSGDAPTQHMTPPTGEAPTQRMPELFDDWGARGSANTAPQPRIDTSPVNRPPSAYQAPNPYQAPPTSYQLPPPPPVWQPPRYPAPPPAARSGSSWAIVLAVILALLLGSIIGGRAIIRRIRERIPAAAPAPPAAPAEDTQTVALNKGAAVTIKAINGSITVEGWDQPQAEVRIIRSSDVPASAVTFRHDGGSLYLEAPQNIRNGKVSFEIKLPRQLGVVTFTSVSGGIKLSDVEGRISVSAVSGGITLDDVAGVESVRSVSGGITANLTGAAKDHPMAFEAVSGNITLNLDDEFDAMLEASSLSGKIDLDDALEGVKVDKGTGIGSRASGQIGTGGPALGVKTVSGRIKITK